MRANLKSFSTLLLCSAVFCSTAVARAQVLNASGQGTYQTYYHEAGNKSYLTGHYYSSVYHSYFVFDLTSVLAPITYAKFSAPSTGTSFYDNGIYSSNPVNTDTFNLYAVSAPVASVEAGFGNQTYQQGLGIYDALVSGPLVGSVTVSGANNNGNVQVVFNGAGLAFINANIGQKIVLGGALSGPNGIFEGNSAANTPTLTMAPEPGTYALVASALLTGVGFLKSRRRTR